MKNLAHRVRKTSSLSILYFFLIWKMIAIYRNGLLPKILYSFEPKKIKTMYDLFARCLELFPNEECLSRRPYNIGLGLKGDAVWQAYTQVSNRIDNFET